MCHVLIIEDDPLAAMDIHLTVAEAGGTSFSIADTHAHAVACARESRPEVIISDVLLAVGRGPEAVRGCCQTNGNLSPLGAGLPTRAVG